MRIWKEALHVSRNCIYPQCAACTLFEYVHMCAQARECVCVHAYCTPPERNTREYTRTHTLSHQYFCGFLVELEIVFLGFQNVLSDGE